MYLYTPSTHHLQQQAKNLLIASDSVCVCVSLCEVRGMCVRCEGRVGWEGGLERVGWWALWGQGVWSSIEFVHWWDVRFVLDVLKHPWLYVLITCCMAVVLSQCTDGWWYKYDSLTSHVVPADGPITSHHMVWWCWSNHHLHWTKYLVHCLPTAISWTYITYLLQPAVLVALHGLSRLQLLATWRTLFLVHTWSCDCHMTLVTPAPCV